MVRGGRDLMQFGRAERLGWWWHAVPFRDHAFARRVSKKVWKKTVGRGGLLFSSDVCVWTLTLDRAPSMLRRQVCRNEPRWLTPSSVYEVVSIYPSTYDIQQRSPVLRCGMLVVWVFGWGSIFSMLLRRTTTCRRGLMHLARAFKTQYYSAFGKEEEFKK